MRMWTVANLAEAVLHLMGVDRLVMKHLHKAKANTAAPTSAAAGAKCAAMPVLFIVPL